jgi:TolB-like protein
MMHLGECGETKSAIDVGNRILRLEPLHDAVVRRLMQLYGGSGRHGTAVHLYRTLAEALRTQLDAQPEAETRAVFEEIAGGSEERTPPAAADAKVSPHTPTMERLSSPLGEFSDATFADAKRLPRYANTAHPSNLPGKPLQAAFRFRAPLVILASVLIVATALVAYPQFALFGTRQAVVVEPTVSASQASAISIAVMPFVNLSSDPEQEFFSDGMTDEITTALTKVSALRVVGRESAFQFRGQKTDMREIGQALGALYLIGGTVRKAGDRVRISVQLTRADNGVNLWAENYDRQLKDIFETQSDVAQAIAGALRVPLGLQQGQTLVSSRTNDEATYEDYLRAKALVRARGLKPLTDAIAMLERVVARDPEFAPAWALLAQAYDGIPSFHPAQNSGAVDEARRVVDATIPKAEAAAQRAIHLDPNLADGYISLGLVQRDRGRLLHAEDLFKQALALDPNNPDALHWYSMLIAEVGRLNEALTMRQKLQALEPFVPVFNQNTAAVLWLNGQNDAAIVILRALSQDSANRALYLASIHAAAGRYSEAADVLLTTPSMTYLPGTVDEAGRLLRAAPASAASQQSLPHLGLLGFIYLYVGAPNRVLEFYESNVQAGYLIPSYAILLWHPSYAPVRKTERFKRLMRDAGLVNFWRARGWPALCSPAGADDFVCT